jgi:hypothetical protein
MRISPTECAVDYLSKRLESKDMAELADLIRAIAALSWPAMVAIALVLLYRSRTTSFVERLKDLLLLKLREISKFKAASVVEAEFNALKGAVTPIAATAEGIGGIANDREASLVRSETSAARYPYLLHEALELRKRTQQEHGRYGVKAWVEADASGFPLSDVRSVTYFLHQTFPKEMQKITTESRQDGFSIRLIVYGEFTLIANITKADGEIIQLSRYLDLPGRPPD